MIEMTMKIIIMIHINITILYIHIHIHTYVHITVLYRNNYLIEIGVDIPSETEHGEDKTMEGNEL